MSSTVQYSQLGGKFRIKGKRKLRVDDRWLIVPFLMFSPLSEYGPSSLVTAADDDDQNCAKCSEEEKESTMTR